MAPPPTTLFTQFSLTCSLAYIKHRSPFIDLSRLWILYSRYFYCIITRCIVPACSSSSVLHVMNQPVHWQSAFWGLATLALNTCLQDCGHVLGFPSKYRYILRSSPFVCLFDTISTIFSLAQRWRRNSFRRSLKLVAEARGIHKSRRQVSSTERLLSVTTFVAATLQFLKLCALRGIPWTRTFGAFYFVSYLAQECLYQFGGPTHTEGPLSSDTGVEAEESQRRGKGSTLGILAIVSQCLFGLYAVGLLFGSSYLEDKGSATYYAAAGGGFILSLPPRLLVDQLGSFLCIVSFGLQISPSFAITWITFTVLRTLHPTLTFYIPNSNDKEPYFPPETNSSTSALTVLIRLVVFLLQIAMLGSLIYLQLHFLGGIWFKRLVPPIIDKTGFFGIDSIWHLSAAFLYHAFKGIGLVLAFGISSFVIGVNTASHIVALKTFKFTARYFLTLKQQRRDPLELEPSHIEKLKNWAAGSFGLMNVGFAIMYYSYIYDEQGTYKPSWTENLG